MGSFSIWHWLIVLAVVLLLFGGRGKISPLMGDFGKGLSAFKKGVGRGTDEDTAAGPAGPAGRRGQADLGPDHHHAAGRTGSPPGQRRQGLRRRFVQGLIGHVRHRQS